MTDLPREILRFADLSKSKPTTRDVRPTPAQLSTLATELGVDTVKKLTFDVKIAPMGKKDWQLSAQLGATVVQPCVVTLDPVTTRIDEKITRKFVAGLDITPEGDEVEMPEDETLEPLGDDIDLWDIMIEALSLSIPAFPRRENAPAVELSVTEPGKEVLKDEDLKPFAGLAKLKETLQKDGEE